MYTSDIAFWIINTSVTFGLLVMPGIIFKITCGSVAFVGAVCDEDYFCDQIEIFNRNGMPEQNRMSYDWTPPIDDLIKEAS